MTFSSAKNAPQDIVNRWEQKNLAGTGTQAMCRSKAQRTAGSAEKEEKCILLRVRIMKPL